MSKRTRIGFYSVLLLWLVSAVGLTRAVFFDHGPRWSIPLLTLAVIGWCCWLNELAKRGAAELAAKAGLETRSDG